MAQPRWAAPSFRANDPGDHLEPHSSLDGKLQRRGFGICSKLNSRGNLLRKPGVALKAPYMRDLIGGIPSSNL
jgi:hypothetical protein